MKRKIIYLSSSEVCDKERILKEYDTTSFHHFCICDYEGNVKMRGTMGEIEQYANVHPGFYDVYEATALAWLDRTRFKWDYWFERNIDTSQKDPLSYRRFGIRDLTYNIERTENGWDVYSVICCDFKTIATFQTYKECVNYIDNLYKTMKERK